MLESSNHEGEAQHSARPDKNSSIQIDSLHAQIKLCREFVKKFEKEMLEGSKDAAEDHALYSAHLVKLEKQATDLGIPIDGTPKPPDTMTSTDTNNGTSTLTDVNGVPRWEKT